MNNSAEVGEGSITQREALHSLDKILLRAMYSKLDHLSSCQWFLCDFFYLFIYFKRGGVGMEVRVTALQTRLEQQSSEITSVGAEQLRKPSSVRVYGCNPQLESPLQGSGMGEMQTTKDLLLPP